VATIEDANDGTCDVILIFPPEFTEIKCVINVATLSISLENDNLVIHDNKKRQIS